MQKIYYFIPNVLKTFSVTPPLALVIFAHAHHQRPVKTAAPTPQNAQDVAL